MLKFEKIDYPSYDIWFIKKFNLKFHGFVQIQQVSLA